MCGTTYYRGALAAVALVIACFATPAGAAQCVARSGERTAALVELYTSEGCSSCPPADRWLSNVGKAFATEQVVPLALHVDYWDYIGWKDRYAQPLFTQRQNGSQRTSGARFAYTPLIPSRRIVARRT